MPHPCGFQGAAIDFLFWFLEASCPYAPGSGTAPTTCTDTATGNVLDFAYNFNLGSADNGNVMGITNNRDNTRSQNFTYDALNRISTAQTQTTGVTIPNSNCWGLTFAYDPWGNLLQQTISGPSGCSEPLPMNLYATANNQLSTSSTQLAGYCYDAAGNLLLNATCPTGSFTPAYSYDAENRMTSTAGVNYTYDGDGKRVMKSSGKIYWYGMSSDALDETDLSGNTNNSSFFEYVFFNGTRIARRDYQNNVDYYLTDHLGTSRVVTNSSGAILDDSDFYPFGGERPACEPNGAPGCTLPPGSGNNYKFTSKERDSESALDNFGARFDSSQSGRFMSPDDGSGQRWENPQSLNLYAYVLNNPLSNVDPTGHDCVYLNNAGNGVESVDQNSNSGECADNHGYWVNGTATGANINSDAGTVDLTGTTNGSDTTSAHYQDNQNPRLPSDFDIRAGIVFGVDGQRLLALNNFAGRVLTDITPCGGNPNLGWRVEHRFEPEDEFGWPGGAETEPKTTLGAASLRFSGCGC